MQSYLPLHNVALRAPAHRIPTPRGPAPTRTRSRWQPYNQNNLSAALPPSRSPPTLNPKTPPLSSSSSSTSSSSSPLQQTPCDMEPIRQQQPFKEIGARSGKSKSILDLVDTASNVLCAIWRPKSIPPAFRSASLAASAQAQYESINDPSHEKGQYSHDSSILPSIPPFESPSGTASDTICPEDEIIDEDTHTLQIRGFIREILRRSKTSGFVLQTALCYLEAIRPKIEKALAEPNGAGLLFESSIEEYISKAPESAIQDSLEDQNCLPNEDDSIMDTIRVSDTMSDAVQFTDKGLQDCSYLTHSTTHPMPSPLQCPRRSFLAALILASKFLQDKCYSNRAWAKLSGLPPREIGRCERALGAALEWRLWIGKSGPQQAATSSQPNSSSRSLCRSRSDSSITGFPSTLSIAVDNDRLQTSQSQSGRSLLRTSSMPSTGFTKSFPETDLEGSLEAMATGCFPPETMSVDSSPSAYKNIESRAIYDRDSPDTESPIPQTPGLTYSPSSSSSSSSGDRTIQMSAFLDDSTIATPCNTFSCGSMTDRMAWLDAKDACFEARPLLSPADSRPPNRGSVTDNALANRLTHLEMANDGNGISYPPSGYQISYGGCALDGFRPMLLDGDISHQGYAINPTDLKNELAPSYTRWTPAIG